MRPGPTAGTEVAGAGPRADGAHSVPTLDDVDASTRVGLGGTQWQLDFARPTGGVGQWFQRRQASLFSGLSVVAIVWLMGWSINAQMSGRRRAEVAVEQATESLRDQEQRFRTLAAASPIGIFLTDARGQVTYANHRLAAILGVHRQRLLDDGLWTYLQPDPLARGRLLQRLSADPEQAVRCTPITEAEDQALSLHATALVDAEGGVTGYTGTVEDITEQVDAHERLAEREATNRALADRFAHQARHDAPTGIPNRVLLLERLSALNEPSEDAAGDLALVLLDLDGFKLINDTLGHAAGDDLLVAISQRLTTCLREDDLLVRLGCDEFAVLLSSGHQPEAALQLTDRLLATIQRPVELARELRNALEQDRLEPAFQPVVDVGTGRIVGVEALARWHHPTLGTVPPAEFIPDAQHAGLIPLLGRHIRHRALSAAQRWWTEHAVQTGINVSARELTEPGYAERLLEDIVLRDAGTEVYGRRVAGEVAFDDPAIIAAAARMAESTHHDDFVRGGTAAIPDIDYRDAPQPLFDEEPGCLLHRQASFVVSFFPEEVRIGEDVEVFAFPTIDGNDGALIAGELAVAFDDRAEVAAFLEVFSGPAAQCAQGSFAGVSRISPNMDTSADCYRDPVVALSAETVLAALEQGTARFDASDLMPSTVGGGTFWSGMNDWMRGEELEEVFARIADSWPA